MTRPPLTAPPARNATVPVPWSVPTVPLMRAVRPNSVMATTEVSFQRVAQALLQGLEGAVESAQQLGEAAGRAALVGVRVPAVERERGDARPVVGGHQLGRALRREAHAAARRGGTAGHALARRHRSVSRPLASAAFRIGSRCA